MGKYWLFFARVDNPVTANSSSTTVAACRLVLVNRLFINLTAATVSTCQLWLSYAANARIWIRCESRTCII